MRLCITSAILGVTLVAGPAAAQSLRAAYLYTLSDFTGSIRVDWSRVAVDRQRNEVYALHQNTVRVFNESGMEVYRFGDDLDIGHIVDVAVDDRGDVFLLSYRDSKAAIVRCNYRGELQARITLKRLPAEFSDFVPNRMVFQQGRFFLASSSGLKIVTADRDGHFVEGFDLVPLLDLEEQDRGSAELGGFSVDPAGNVLMTIPVLFRAFVMSRDGTVTAFGRAGSAPGRFNIVGGIARDREGNVLVVDKAKGAVLVFDPTLKFVSQFATRGSKPGQLLTPGDLAIDDRGTVYVTQAGKRGVSVFRLTHD